MAEIKQTNFRIDQETADAFRKFCEENGMNQAQGFDHVMQVVALDKAKSSVPSRITEIESFEKSVKDIMDAYLYSIKINQDAEERIREQFTSDLERKDATIDDLRAKIEKIQYEKEDAEARTADAMKTMEQSVKDAAAAEKLRIAAEKAVEDKQAIADTLASKLAEAEKKIEGYDDLKSALSASEDALKVAEQRIKDIQRDAAEAAKDAARSAERDKEEAVKQISDTLQEKISSLRDELRLSKSETDAARKDAETARTAAIAELSQAHKSEISEVRLKLDARIDDLMEATQKVGELQMKSADLERQLRDARLEIEALKSNQ